MSPDIALWIGGHTHGSFRLRDEASGVPLVCNPRGYHRHGRHENPEFDPGAAFRVG